MKPNLSHIIKKILPRIVDITYVAVIAAGILFLLRYVLLFVAFDTFHTPTSSMTPTIRPDYTGLVSKLKLGGRVFDFRAADEGRPFTVRRLPGYGKLEKNDIIVFNVPWTNGWDSIAMNMRLYYCKRVVATAGDTLEVKEGHYRVRGFKGTLGVPSEQENVRLYVDHIRRITPDSVPMGGSVYASPRDSSLNWTIADMGPLVVPAKGMTVKLDRKNFLLYRKCIEWETGKKLRAPDAMAFSEQSADSVATGPLYADSTAVLSRSNILETEEYTFRENYCFTAGDHAVDSQDSRYWGFLPEKYIVGTVVMPNPRSFPGVLSRLMIAFLRL